MLAVVSGVDKYRVIGMGSECLVVATPAGYSVVSMCRCTPDMNDELTALAMGGDPSSIQSEQPQSPEQP
ncbi:MAG: hypothetical protein B7C55_09905 [Actinomycetales bacterium mxb001]|nr:MAG: hypothetical protein B7C55_09905 [Actinomycetales bacterium mxb001]